MAVIGKGAPNFGKVAVNTGDISVTTDPVTVGTATEERIETTTDRTIPAGKRSVTVTNAGNAGGGEFATVQANGFSISVNGSKTFDSYLDPVTNVFKRTGAVQVVTNGAMVWIDVKD